MEGCNVIPKWKHTCNEVYISKFLRKLKIHRLRYQWKCISIDMLVDKMCWYLGLIDLCTFIAIWSWMDDRNTFCTNLTVLTQWIKFIVYELNSLCKCS